MSETPRLCHAGLKDLALPRTTPTIAASLGAGNLPAALQVQPKLATYGTSSLTLKAVVAAEQRTQDGVGAGGENVLAIQCTLSMVKGSVKTAISTAFADAHSGIAFLDGGVSAQDYYEDVSWSVDYSTLRQFSGARYRGLGIWQRFQVTFQLDCDNTTSTTTFTMTFEPLKMKVGPSGDNSTIG